MGWRSRPRLGCALLLFLSLAGRPEVHAGEVIQETASAVVVRQHPKTGQPYVSIVRTGAAPRTIFQEGQKKFKRPDYRMLDPRVSPKSVGYDGPVSDRKKIYVLAGTLAAAGVASYAALPVAAAGGGAAGGAGLYAAAGGAVAAGTLSTHWVMQRSDGPDDFTHTALSREIALDEGRG